MTDTFEIPVIYNNAELLLKAQLVKAGYTYKFNVEVEDTNIMFEPDEENNYRAVVEPEKLADLKHVNTGLLQAIAGTLGELVK
ncbi:hypothetical protein EXU57_23645 [Segetibacter sp. 3557_3]|uniref:hypothetical protein n=1 Tax=Segetibacter sp. 3557_3 TaxID=2547429 RepID=UPI001058CE53|nr:hypothetical protein [Segetibacter sp. 3557_3]TDH18354.1 hypothetical protein EXU57_23645 [Segetibacter sp. 3557_3]